ncbi:MAG: hypothetical protein GXO90_09125 [FCB group bacterium]|nr:hypothetical protein [FCB group bacterium]
MKTVHRIVIIILALIVAGILFWSLDIAGSYYLASSLERPRMEAHQLWKPGGIYGHGLGILGSVMILLLLTYSARKRIRKFRRWGKLPSWLNYHIFLGITGPLLITLHTTFKFGGLVSISYWSMMAVMLSGFIGRYIYVKIPRKINGEEMSRKEIEAHNEELKRQLTEEFRLSSDQLALIEQVGGVHKIKQRGLFGIFTFFIMDLFNWLTLRRISHLVFKSASVPKARLREFHHLLSRRVRNSRRIAFLQAAQKLFHYWHVIHKPFAYTMIVIMIVHVTVVITLGYRWIY